MSRICFRRTMLSSSFSLISLERRSFAVFSFCNRLGHSFIQSQILNIVLLFKKVFRLVLLAEIWEIEIPLFWIISFPHGPHVWLHLKAFYDPTLSVTPLFRFESFAHAQLTFAPRLTYALLNFNFIGASFTTASFTITPSMSPCPCLKHTLSFLAWLVVHLSLLCILLAFLHLALFCSCPSSNGWFSLHLRSFFFLCNI